MSSDWLLLPTLPLARLFPAWLAERLGLDITAGDAADWRLDAAWYWPPWATLLLVIGVVLWFVFLYTREASSAGRGYRALLAVLRIAACLFLLVMIAHWALALRLTGPPAFALVIDRSSSMGIADRYDREDNGGQLTERLGEIGVTEPSRLNLTKLLLSEHNGRLLSELARRYRLEVYSVAEGVERLPKPAAGDELLPAVRALTSDGPGSGATRLGDALRHVLDDFRGAPPAGIMLFTDGINTEGLPLSDAAQAARQKGVPLLTVGLGRDDPAPDVELTDVLVDDVVFAGDLVSFQVQAKATGLAGESAEVVLRRAAAAAPLASQAISLPADGQSITLQLVDRPTEPGDIDYTVEITPRHDERDRDNNRQHRVVAVRDQKIRVLMIFGYPNYEFRFLKTLLERDPTVRLSTFLQDADPEYLEQDKSALPSVPVGHDELSQYDVLLIGDVDPRLLPRSFWHNVRTFVAEQGGGAAFVAGPRYLPWLYRDNADVNALLPIDLDALPLAADNALPAAVARGFVVMPTPLGLRTAAMQLGDTPAQTEQIWHRLAPLYWLVEVGDLKPAAQVLATGPASPSGTGSPHAALPVICFQYFGAGRVLFHAIDSTWRWRIGVGDAYFARYWVQSIRQLARGKLGGGRGVELAADRREYRRGEPVHLRARFRDARLAPAGDDGVVVLVESPGQARRRATLRRNPAAAGVFEATLADLGEGHYQALLADPQLPGEPPTARFAVVAPPGELTRTEMDRAGLQAAAALTRGHFYTLADADRLLAELPAGRRVPIENLPPIPLWNRWWLLALFLACITSEWLLRKRKGML